MAGMAVDMDSKGQIRNLLLVVRQQTGRDLDRTVILQIFSSLSEALSVALVIPLLHILGEGGKALEFSLSGQEFSVSLPVILAGFVLLILLRSLAQEKKEAFNARVVFGFVENMSSRLFAALAATRWSVVSRWRISDMAQAVTGDGDRLLITLTLLLKFIQSIAMAAIFTVLSFLISWQMTLAAMVIGCVLLLVTMPARRHAMEQGKKLADARKAQFRLTDEFLNGLRTAKSFGLEGQYYQDMCRELAAMRSGNISLVASRARTSTLYQVSTAMALAGIIFFAFAYVEISLARTVALLFLYMRLAPRIIALHSTLQELQAQMSAVEAILKLLADAEKEAEVLPADTDSGPQLSTAIHLQNVSFRYPDQDQHQERPALSGITAKIPAGKITAIVGPTGSGKSTLVDIILGLLVPDSGKVCVDNTWLDGSALRGWRRQIAYVPQETFLFNTTIAENLRVADPDASDQAVWEALALADAADFVRALPEGLDSPVGNRGSRLSGGEQQRLSIARALLRKPDVLVLDEATSALDAHSQRRIVDAISSLGKTMTIIAVAHRASMVLFADKVIALDKGHVCEQGALAEIRSSCSGPVNDLIEADRHDVCKR